MYPQKTIKMVLPHDFTAYTRPLLGDELYEKLLAALSEEPPVSIRLNPFKTLNGKVEVCNALGHVAWNDEGCYLSARPNFTFDPLFHAGAYYVQEASSMFVSWIVRQMVHSPITMLDLCAAPGGKSTALRAALPQGSLLFCNEPIGQRASVLAENMQKFGHPDVVATNNLAADYRKSGLQFDAILADVPCSGEGMFRKDAGAVAEWSTANVEHCWRLQREIIAEIWPCLKPGGLLIYSTCTFNDKENERNVEWIVQELGADPDLPPLPSAWNIMPSINSDIPACRFIPGITKGEGLFLCVLRKRFEQNAHEANKKAARKGTNQKAVLPEMPQWLKANTDFDTRQINGYLHAIPCSWTSLFDKASAALRIIHAGIGVAQPKGKGLVPHPSLAHSIALAPDAFCKCELDYASAIAFLRREAVALPAETPRGHVLVAYQGMPLGFVKNIGNRANNLYPQEWRIKSTHIQQPQQIIMLR